MIYPTPDMKRHNKILLDFLLLLEKWELASKVEIDEVLCELMEHGNGQTREKKTP